MVSKIYPLHLALLLTVFSFDAIAADDKESADNEPPDCRYCPDETGWSGWIEGGVGYLSDDNYHFGRYLGDVDEGGMIDASGEVNYRDEDGTFVEGSLENLGMDSRRIRVQGGIQGRYEIGLEYDELPNYRERNAYTPFRVQADGSLGLPAGWVSGPTTYALPSLGGALTRTTLETHRDRTGANFKYLPDKRWELSGFARHEKKDGTKDLGATFGFDQTMILPVPFKYETDEFGLSVGYTGKDLQAQVSYSGSLFENGRDSIVWRNPFENATSDTAWGRAAEQPDNQFHQFSALIGYQLREDTRIGVRFSRGRMTQDESLLPYTINPAIAATALPTSSLDGKVDTTMAAFEITSRPMRRLRLNASYTYSDRDNKTDVFTYNYVVADEGPGGSRINRPYSFKQKLLRLKAGYRFPKDINLSVGFDDDRKERTYVEVKETQEQTGWAKLKLRPLDSLEVTLKSSYGKRDSSPYIPLASVNPLLDNPNPNYYNNPLMRAYQFADRTRRSSGLSLAYSATDTLSLGFDLDYSKDDYDSSFLGLQSGEDLTYTVSASYTFSETLFGSAYYTYDKLSSEQENSQKLLSTAAEDIWVLSDRNRTQTVGLGLNWQAIEDKLDIGVDVTHSKFDGNVDFATAAALPEIGSTLKAVNLHGEYKLSDEMSVRMELKYEDYDEQDWTKDGNVNTMPTLLSLGTIPQNEAHYLAFVAVRYSF